MGNCLPCLPGAESAKIVALRKAKKELEALIEEKNCGPILIRFAWHDSGTYDQRIKEFPQCGGANGAIRFDPELTMGANAGLSKAKGYCEDILKAINVPESDISWADLIQLASATAVEKMGGPKIDMKYGRVAVTNESECAGPKSREGFADNTGLPDAKPPFGCGASDPAQHLRNVFGKKMGFTDQEIVALSGAHTVGKCHIERSGFDGAWTEEPLKFDNAYFKDLVNKKYAAETTAKGKPQHRHAASGTIMLVTDLALLEDEKFSKHVKRYAVDQEAFFADYTDAWARLQENGCHNLRDIL